MGLSNIFQVDGPTFPTMKTTCVYTIVLFFIIGLSWDVGFQTIWNIGTTATLKISRNFMDDKQNISNLLKQTLSDSLQQQLDIAVNTPNNNIKTLTDIKLREWPNLNLWQNKSETIPQLLDADIVNTLNNTKIGPKLTDWTTPNTTRNWEQQGDLCGNKTVAMGMAITTKGKWLVGSMSQQLPLFTNMLPSFCTTRSEGYCYTFYIAYDYNDRILSIPFGRTIFRTIFDRIVNEKCAVKHNATVAMTLIECPYEGKPAWAQNDAMMAAYYENKSFYYMLNDDTILLTADWTTLFHSNLKASNPAYFGLTGPHHIGGKETILTYDFVHKTHIDIFGFFYPRVFPTWYADDWINDIYLPYNVKKLTSVQVLHTQQAGRRYQVDYASSSYIWTVITQGKRTLAQWLKPKGITYNMDLHNLPCVSVGTKHYNCLKSPEMLQQNIINAQIALNRT